MGNSLQNKAAEVKLSLLHKEPEIDLEKFHKILSMKNEECLMVSHKEGFSPTSFTEMGLKSINELVRTLSLLDFAIREEQEDLIANKLQKLKLLDQPETVKDLAS